jgi:hypothetical protein
MNISILILLLSISNASSAERRLSNSDPEKSDSSGSIDRLTTASGSSDLPSEPFSSGSPIIANKPWIEGGKGKQQGVDWSGVLAQSGVFLAAEHGYRLGTQPNTRAALKGEFFDDWFQSVKSTKGWGDGDDFLTNYIGHTMEGSVVSNIYVHNDPRGRNQTFGWNSGYWNSRLKAMIWCTIYSTQFELGPISEASIGNVGHQGKSQSGAVDLVVTPLAGLGWQVGEDVLDKYLIVKIETWTQNPVILMIARSLLNPTRSFANAMRFAVPWSRDTRPGIWKGRANNR